MLGADDVRVRPFVASDATDFQRIEWISCRITVLASHIRWLREKKVYDFAAAGTLFRYREYLYDYWGGLYLE